MSQFGLRAALRTVVDALADVARLGLLTLRSRTQLASFIETFTRDETQQLRDAGIVTDEGVCRFVATTADTHTS
jgi:hypothetical protein